MAIETITALYDYDRWANRRLLEAVSVLPQGTAEREIGTQFSFPTLKGTLAHILAAEVIWLSRWKGHSPSTLLSAKDFPDIQALRSRWSHLEAELSAFLAGLSAADLTRVVRYTNTEGKSFALRLGPLMQHVANHSTHHRSEVATMLTMLGVAPPPTDLVIYHLVESGQMS